MKKAELTLRQRLYFLVGRLFFAFMSALGVFVIYLGAQSRDVLTTIAGLAGTVLFLDCLKGYARFPQPSTFGLEHGFLVTGDARIPLQRIQAARVVRLKPCTLTSDTYRPPALRLDLESHATLILPLVPKGWDEVYEVLRAARPDLGLLPWSEVPEIIEALYEHINTSVALPKGVKIVYRRRALAVLAAVATAVASGLVIAVSPLPSELAGLAGPLSLATYALVVEKQIRLPNQKQNRA